MDSMSATQKVLDENLQQRREKSEAALTAVVDGKQSWDEARRPIVDAGHLVLEFDQLNHAGISDVKRGLGGITGELKNLAAAVSESNGHDPVIQKGPLKGIPIKYAFASVIVLAFLAAGIIVAALHYGKLNEVVDLVNAAKGRPTAAVASPDPGTAEAVARATP